MEDQCSTPAWVYYQQEEDIEELKHTLFCTTLELETTVVSAQEEIRRRDNEVNSLKDLLSRTIKERDEAQARYKKLMLEKLLMLGRNFRQHTTTPLPAAAPPVLSAGTSSGGTDDEPSSNSDEYSCSLSPPQLQPAADHQKPLPEKGKLLQAVLEAGPLLQTLLLAGPLPQWQHPPPQLDSIEIPPVAIPSPPTPPLLQPDISVNNATYSKKRGQTPFEDSHSFSPNKKHQRAGLFTID